MTLKPDPTITIPGMVENKNSINPGTITSVAERFGIGHTDLTFEVRDNDQWVKVEKATQIGNGCLRYVRDGYGLQATAGNWRVKMDEEYKQLEEKVKEKVKGFGIAAIFCFLAIVIIYIFA